MDPMCFTETEITFKCNQFRNPIVPKVYEGFQIATFDNSPVRRMIEQTREGFFNATHFDPAVIEASAFTIQPTENVIATSSAWVMSLKMPIPLEMGCFIKLYVPNDLQYDFQSADASGMFSSSTDFEVFLTSNDLTYNDTDVPSPSVLFRGCQNPNGVGRWPTGMLNIRNIYTPSQIKDSGGFYLAVFKDERQEMELARITDGVSIIASTL